MSRTRRRRTPVAVMIGAPVVMLLVGGTVGWFMRDDASSGRAGRATRSNSPIATVVGAPLPIALDSMVPQRPLPPAANPAVIDPASIIGLDTAGVIEVPAAAAFDLPLVPGGSATPVHPVTRGAVQPTSPYAPSIRVDPSCDVLAG